MKRTWAENWQLVAQLWDSWKPTPAQLAEWTSRLGPQARQDWVEQAIRDHWACDGKDGSDFQPRLSRVLARFSAIAESGDRADGVTFVRWRACWRDGNGVHRCSHATFHNREGAEWFAGRMGTEPCTLRIGDPEGLPPGHAEACEADAQAVLADMLAWDATRRKRAVAELSRLGVLCLVGVEEFPDDVRQWSRTARGLAHAADERLEASRIDRSAKGSGGRG